MRLWHIDLALDHSAGSYFVAVSLGWRPGEGFYMLQPVEEKPVGQVRHTPDQIAGRFAAVEDTVDHLAVVVDIVGRLAVVEDIVGHLGALEDTVQVVPKHKTVSASISYHFSQLHIPMNH